MYTIVHLPTNTFYGLNRTEKHSVVYFKKYENAKYVADSLSTHVWIYGSMPKESKELHMMKPYQKKREALENHIWVQKRDLSKQWLMQLGMRNLNVLVVKNIDWLDDDEYDADIENYSLESDNAAFLKMVELDNEIVVE